MWRESKGCLFLSVSFVFLADLIGISWTVCLLICLNIPVLRTSYVFVMSYDCHMIVLKMKKTDVM